MLPELFIVFNLWKAQSYEDAFDMVLSLAISLSDLNTSSSIAISTNLAPDNLEFRRRNILSLANSSFLVVFLRRWIEGLKVKASLLNSGKEEIKVIVAFVQYRPALSCTT